MDIASLGLKVDSSGVQSGTAALDDLAKAAQGAEAAEQKLGVQAKATGAAVADQGKSVAQSTASMSAAAAASNEIAKANNSVAASVKAISSASGSINSDALAQSYREQVELLGRLDIALARTTQSEIGLADTQALIEELSARNIISTEERVAALKIVETQERATSKAASAHTAELQALLKSVDPVGQSLINLAAQEAKLTEAFRVGDISQKTYIKGISQLSTQKVKLEAEAAAAGIGELDKGLKGVSLTSAFALREYTAMANGFARGNIGQVAREAGTLAVRGQLLGAIFNPLGITIGVTALALGTFAAAAIVGAKETTAFENSLLFTGNAAGTTTGQMQLLSAEIGKTVGTQHSASVALAEFAATGKISAENLKEFVTIAEKLALVGGPSVAETAKQFAELGKDPVQASIKLNEQYHYLTAGVYDQIKALADQNKTVEAGELAQKTFAAAQKQRADEAISNLHGIELAWLRVKDGASISLNAILNIGRSAGPDQQLADLQAKRGTRELGDITARSKIVADQQRADDEHEKSLQTTVDLQHSAAKAQADAVAETDRQIKADTELNNILAARLARDVTVQTARLGSQQSGVQNELNRDLTAYTAYQATLAAQRSAGLISAKDYYTAQTKIITDETDVRIKALRDESAIIQRENALVQGAAKIQISQLKGPNADAEAIGIQAAADAKQIASQQKIADNETKIFELRRQSATQLSVINTENRAAAVTLNRYNVELENQRTLLGYDIRDREVEAQILDREHYLRTQGIVLSKSEESALRATLTGLRDYNEVISAQDRLLQNTVGQSRAYTTQLTAIKNLLAKPGSGFGKEDAAQALTSALGSDVLNGTKTAELVISTYDKMYAKLDEARKADLLSAADASRAKLNIWQLEHQEQIGNLGTALGQVASLTNSGNRKAFEAGKAAAIAQATLSAGTAIINAYATSPWYVGLALGIGAAANLYGQIEQIKNTQFQGYMSGGYTGDGPTDSIAGVTHGQEFVMNSAATARIGVSTLQALQSGTVAVPNAGTRAAASGASSAPANMKLVIEHHGTPQAYQQVPGLSSDEVRLIARDVVNTDTPKLVSSQMRNPNSKISKSIGTNTQTARRR